MEEEIPLQMKRILTVIGGYYTIDILKASVSLFKLTGDSNTITNGLNNARTNAMLTESASCLLQGLYDTA